MEQVTVSSKGQIAIPKKVRDALNLSDGSKLTVEVHGQSIVLSKQGDWRKLRGAAAGTNLMETFMELKKQERDR